MSPDSRRPWIALTTPKKKNKPTFTELDLNDDEEDEDFDPNTAQVRLQSQSRIPSDTGNKNHWVPLCQNSYQISHFFLLNFVYYVLENNPSRGCTGST